MDTAAQIITRIRHEWLPLLYPGDWIALLFGVALVGISLPLSFHAGQPAWAEIRVDGEVKARMDLSIDRRLSVAGAIGSTEIEVRNGRARVVSDPGPRQYCVRQGWLSRPGEVAVCAPNHVTLRILGRDMPYDSVSF